MKRAHVTSSCGMNSSLPSAVQFFFGNETAFWRLSSAPYVVTNPLDETTMWADVAPAIAISFRQPVAKAANTFESLTAFLNDLNARAFQAHAERSVDEIVRCKQRTWVRVKSPAT
jgi:hypothetical protein